MKPIEIIWIATAIVLTTATQLRFAGPIGLGEIMLAIWLAVAGFRVLQSSQYYFITPTTRVFFWFWIVAYISLIGGFITAEFMQLASAEYMHNAVALLLMFIFCIVFSFTVSSQTNLNQILLAILSLSIVPLTILLIFPTLVPWLNPLYGGVRFVGWAENPNQLALLLNLFPFFACYLFRQSHNGWMKLWCFVLFSASLIMGWQTDSDALYAGWGVGALLLLLLMLYQGYSTFAKKLINREKYHALMPAITSLFILCAIFASTLIFHETISDGVEYFVNNTYNQVNSSNQQIDGRFALWSNGLAAIDRSPLFGLGPGPHSGLRQPFSELEAHNSFIDWASNSGLVGLISYIALLGWIGWNIWCSRFKVLGTGLAALLIFTCFHYVFRQPIFWLDLLAIAKLSAPVTRTALNVKKSVYKNSVKPMRNLAGRIVRY